MIESRAHIANGLILAALVVGSILAFADLPAEIPRHFGITGDPDAWWPTNWLTWCIAPAVGILIALGLYVLAGFLRRHAKTINVPNQKEFDALSERDKRNVAAIAQRYLYWTAFGVLLLFSTIQFSVYEIAMGNSRAFPSYVVLFIVLVILAMVGGALWVGIASARRVARLHSNRSGHSGFVAEEGTDETD